jgi:muramoyltetrapeptide carboxypeptidase
MDIPTIHPPRLKTGDSIAIVAPAGPIEHRDSMNLGISALERMGFRVRFEERIFQSSRYLAGSDADRAEELMTAFEDSEIQAIVAMRGGYGCSRLIPLMHERRLRGSPKLFMGFSDLTTLHMYFRRRFGWITIHGPMATTLGRMELDQESHLISLMTDPGYHPSLSFPQLEAWKPGVAEGVLAGGCLSIVTASIGTPYEIKTEGKILFLEDQGEPPYRLDRMLTHLRLSGKLDNISGLILGDFLDCDPFQGDDSHRQSGYTAKEALQEILEDLDVPIMAGFPAGHGNANWALPLGLKIRIDANSRAVQFLDSVVI